MSIGEIIIIIACVVVIALVCLLVFRKPQTTSSQIEIEKLENLIATQKELSLQLNQLVLSTIKDNNDTMVATISQNHSMQFQQQSDVLARLNTMLQTSEQSMKNAINVIENGLLRIGQENEKKLEQMRQTVDEKLNSSLENRLTQSFNIINQRLESVYEGIGVMKQLASGVGDLKKVLTNVKTRGVWGEVQLGNMLEQILTNDQFASQININPQNQERVDFAVKMPGKDEEIVLLPIDAKFPIEDYQRLIEASESGNREEIDIAVKGIEKRIKDEAKHISEKYIMLPKTTDFAVMYLSIEGLYAEVLRIPGLVEHLQQKYKVVVCGPTTLSALLNSLQLGFKTLSIEKRSSEVWQLLGVIKQEFSKYVELLAKTQKKLSEASNTIEFATKKSRTIERKLKNVSGVSEMEQIDFQNEIEIKGEEDDE
ncbi:MAG: DNA recombination protein RmuC [Clostridia bacterium]|nr:DNA recombination protein RmuC [Clostridia bacterium]